MQRLTLELLFLIFLFTSNVDVSEACFNNKYNVFEQDIVDPGYEYDDNGEFVKIIDDRLWGKEVSNNIRSTLENLDKEECEIFKKIVINLINVTVKNRGKGHKVTVDDINRIREVSIKKAMEIKKKEAEESYEEYKKIVYKLKNNRKDEGIIKLAS